MPHAQSGTTSLHCRKPSGPSLSENGLTQVSNYNRWYYARALRRKPANRGDIWHLDEVRIVIDGQPHWLWRAVDQHGYVLDEILQTRRNTKAAKRLLTQLLRR